MEKIRFVMTETGNAFTSLCRRALEQKGAEVMVCEKDGEKVTLLHIKENRKRSYHIKLNEEYEKLTLTPIESWGDNDTTQILSFDYN